MFFICCLALHQSQRRFGHVAGYLRVDMLNLVSLAFKRSMQAPAQDGQVAGTDIGSTATFMRPADKVPIARCQLMHQQPSLIQYFCYPPLMAPVQPLQLAFCPAPFADQSPNQLSLPATAP